ncbi:MAG: ORF6N domain-containing protein [Phycisphaerales bacterium]
MDKRRLKPRAKSEPILQPDQVEQSIVVVRGVKVLLDEQLAGFYGVDTRVLVQQVKRNANRFPADFMIRLTRDEWAALKSQFVISRLDGHGGRRRSTPLAFTEQGVAMLSGILRSKQAIFVNIEIMRAFVRLRQLLHAHKQLADHIARLEKKMVQRNAKVDQQIEQIMALLSQLFNPPDPPRKPIGFHSEMGK